MANQSEPNPRPRKSSQPGLRTGAALLVVALMLGGLFLVFDFSEDRPNFYQPARDSITNAALVLSQTYHDEKVLQNKLQSVHRQLDNAIDLLGKAKVLDPADKREIEVLQVRLRALEDPNRLAASDPETLKHSYYELIEQLHTLAEKLAKPNS